MPRHQCRHCGYIWDTANEDSPPQMCPQCEGDQDPEAVEEDEDDQTAVPPLP